MNAGGEGALAGSAARRKLRAQAAGRAGRRLASPACARLWAGQAVSAFGDSVFVVTAVLWARQLGAGHAWGAAAVSGIPGAAYAAVAVAGPLAGTVADRFDRRTVMAVTELVRAGLAGVLAAAAFLPAGRLPAGAWLAGIYLTVFALNAVGQLFVPARVAAVAALVPVHRGRVRAAGTAQAAASAAGLCGPLAAVPLMLAGGVRWAVAVNAVSYLVSWLSVRSLPRLPPDAGREGADPGFRAGLRAFWGSRYMRSLIFVTALCQLGTGVVTALTVLAVTGYLHGSAGDYGVAQALMGAGYVTGAVAAGLLAARAGARSVTSAGLVAAGLFTAGYALSRSLPPGLVLLAGYAVAIGVLEAATEPYLMGAVPGRYLGRVMSVYGPVNQAAAAVSVLGSGWLASGPLHGFRTGSLGPVSLLLLGGAVLIVASGVLARVTLPDLPAAGGGRAGGGGGLRRAGSRLGGANLRPRPYVSTGSRGPGRARGDVTGPGQAGAAGGPGRGVEGGR